jgi:murein DD-endopeptidase MepM/ murein hydrolase activator NlpD
MQYAYEDRLASLRVQLDRVTSRQLLDQDTLEGRVHELLSRQAQIETRASVISMLADQAGVREDVTSSIPRPAPQTKGTPAKGAGNPLLSAPASPLPAGAASFAPLPGARAPQAEKPRPEPLEQRGDVLIDRLRTLSAVADPAVPVETRLRVVTGSLDSFEIKQVRTIAAIGSVARQTVSRLRTAINEAGLNVDRLAAPGKEEPAPMGGPFIPIKADPKGSLFEREVHRLQGEFHAAARLRRVARQLPFRQPLTGPLDITSPFGGRADPFLGRLATHAGLDLRDPAGTPVRATGGGKVVSAGWNGGYGNMIEIDHGHGLTTRYAHLSAILVSEDQQIEAGAIIGKLGSTGRSTGPHLHYETRIDGVAVDPQRFLRAGAKFGAGG